MLVFNIIINNCFWLLVIVIIFSEAHLSLSSGLCSESPSVNVDSSGQRAKPMQAQVMGLPLHRLSDLMPDLTHLLLLSACMSPKFSFLLCIHFAHLMQEEHICENEGFVILFWSRNWQMGEQSVWTGLHIDHRIRCWCFAHGSRQ